MSLLKNCVIWRSYRHHFFCQLHFLFYCSPKGCTVPARRHTTVGLWVLLQSAGKKKTHCQVISSNTATDFKRGLHRSVMTHLRRCCIDRHYHIVKRQEQGSPSKEEEEEEYLSSVPWTKKQKKNTRMICHSLASEWSIPTHGLTSWASSPQCLRTTIYSNLLQNVRELHCLREIQITREVDLGAKIYIYSFFPGEEEGGGGGGGETRNRWGVLQKSIILF